jgi:hypothetical protein
MFSPYAKLDKTALSTVKSLGKQCKQLEELNWCKNIYLHGCTDLCYLYTLEHLLQKKRKYIGLEN